MNHLYIKNPEYLEEMDLLVIDMSLKTVQRTIDQMEKFKSVKTLIITGGKFGTAVDLTDLLKKSKKLSFGRLYIINFKIFVSSIPTQIKQFKNLKLLAVFDNQISSLPSEIGSLFSLETLYIDVNPISSVLSDGWETKTTEVSRFSKNPNKRLRNNRNQKTITELRGVGIMNSLIFSVIMILFISQ